MYIETIPKEYWFWIQDVLNKKPREKFGFESLKLVVDQELNYGYA